MHILKSVFAASALVSLLATPAVADTWRIANFSDNEAVLIDVDSIRTTTSGKVAWFAFVPYESQEGIAYSTQRLEMRCREDKYWLIAGATFSETGQMLDSVENPSRFQTAFPGTNGKLMLDVLCTGSGGEFSNYDQLTFPSIVAYINEMAEAAEAAAEAPEAQAPEAQATAWPVP